MAGPALVRAGTQPGGKGKYTGAAEEFIDGKYGEGKPYTLDSRSPELQKKVDVQAFSFDHKADFIVLNLDQRDVNADERTTSFRDPHGTEWMVPVATVTWHLKVRMRSARASRYFKLVFLRDEEWEEAVQQARASEEAASHQHNSPSSHSEHEPGHRRRAERVNPFRSFRSS
ncbi:hypothetical protein Rhopal_003494-T1 [Rhodotorula paludigena]|uniref:Uncharacterized protein n=1 Tax=Rhodotorula paludigena TaxID=86838 RepID=A0AAV5GJR9_9BASI|nr:hypothetical protein Rhopal_003494-T1 [Rhodotorula paludigena]